MPIVAGSANLTARNLYAFVRNVKMPGAKDLREPVTFYRSVRRPVTAADGTPGFEQDITPYHNAWAYVWQSQITNLDGQNTENFASHVFIVRNYPGFAPEERDGIVWNGVIHQVRGTRNIEGDTKHLFLIIIAEQEGAFSEEPRDNTTTPEDADHEPAAADPLNPLWL